MTAKLCWPWSPSVLVAVTATVASPGATPVTVIEVSEIEALATAGLDDVAV